MNNIIATRRTVVNVWYRSKDSAGAFEDISQAVGLFILSFSYTDGASGEADDVQLTLEDSQGRWQRSRKPAKGDQLRIELLAFGRVKGAPSEKLACGFFEVDELTLNGPPDVVSLKAIAVPVTSSLRGQKKNKSWEAVSLAVILREIAAANGNMEQFFTCSDDPFYKRVEQNQQSDLEFLHTLCEKAGLALKVTSGKIVIFDEQLYESKPAVMTIQKRGSTVINYSFSSSSRECYAACKVLYYDAVQKAVLEHEFKPVSAPDTGQVLVVNERVDSREQAEILAKKLLRQKNKEETKASLTVAGNVGLMAGRTVLLQGWGAYDGKYIIERAGHDYGGGGYTVGMELRKTLEGY